MIRPCAITCPYRARTWKFMFQRKRPYVRCRNLPHFAPVVSWRSLAEARLACIQKVMGPTYHHQGWRLDCHGRTLQTPNIGQMEKRSQDGPFSQLQKAAIVHINTLELQSNPMSSLTGWLRFGKNAWILQAWMSSPTLVTSTFTEMVMIKWVGTLMMSLFLKVSTMIFAFWACH